MWPSPRSRSKARAFGYRDPLVKLHGLDPAGRYRDERTGLIHHGALLATHGLENSTSTRPTTPRR
jgi:hypothetical protein